MPSRSLRESISRASDAISTGINDTIDTVKSNLAKGRANAARYEAAKPATPASNPVRGQSNRNLLKDSAPRSIVNRKRNIDKAVDDNAS